MASCSEICGSEYGAVNGHQYGVRSYLHQFYEECTGSLWDREADFQTQRSPSRWSSVLWKVRPFTAGPQLGLTAAPIQLWNKPPVVPTTPVFNEGLRLPCLLSDTVEPWLENAPYK